MDLQKVASKPLDVLSFHLCLQQGQTELGKTHSDSAVSAVNTEDTKQAADSTSTSQSSASSLSSSDVGASFNPPDFGEFQVDGKTGKINDVITRLHRNGQLEDWEITVLGMEEFSRNVTSGPPEIVLNGVKFDAARLNIGCAEL